MINLFIRVSVHSHINNSKLNKKINNLMQFINNKLRFVGGYL